MVYEWLSQRGGMVVVGGRWPSLARKEPNEENEYVSRFLNKEIGE